MLKDKNDEKLDLKMTNDEVTELVNETYMEPETVAANGSALPEHAVSEANDSVSLPPATPAKVALNQEQIKMMTADLPSYYTVIDILGEGGMGAVFKVRDTRIDKLFAIKMLRSEFVHEEIALDRFHKEARAAKAMTHVNLAAVYDYGIGRHGTPYLVMDYLDGKSLEDIIKAENGLSIPRAIDLFLQMVEAVGYAHARGVVHRDLKPSNMIVERGSGETEMVKLVDFGIAKSLLATDNGKTRTGDVIGSPPYMSPEQCEGLRLDARSDIYSLGCVMYETLCGHPPFVGKNSIQTILKHMRDVPVPISEASQRQSVPEDLNYIIMRCLEKDRNNRYENIAALQKDLRVFKSGKPVKQALPKSTQSEAGQVLWPSLTETFKKASPVTVTVMIAAVVTCLSAAVIAININAFQLLGVSPSGASSIEQPGSIPTWPSKPVVHTRLDTLARYVHGVAYPIPEIDGPTMERLATSYVGEGKFLQAARLYEFAAHVQSGKGFNRIEEDQALACYMNSGNKDLVLQKYDKLFQELDSTKQPASPEWVHRYAELLRQAGQNDRARNIEMRWL